MRLRYALLYLSLLLLVLAVVFELSLMFPNTGEALQWQPWEIA